MENLFDFIMLILLLSTITIGIYNIYDSNFKSKNLTLDESESITPKYIKLLRLKRK